MLQIIVIVILALGVVTFVFFFASWKVFRAGVRRDFIAYVRNALPNLEIDEYPDRLEVREGGGEAGTLYLHNLYGQIAHVSLDDKVAVRELFERFTGTLREGLSAVDRSIDPIRDRERLFPRLVTTALLQETNGSGRSVPHRPFSNTGLHVAYVFDAVHSMTYVTEDMLPQLGLSGDDLHATALTNLRRRFPREVVRGVLEKRAMSVVKSGDGYDAARLLIVPEYLEEGEEVAAAVPDRDTLVIAPKPADDDWRLFKKVSATAAGPALLLLPLLVTRAGVAVVK